MGEATVLEMVLAEGKNREVRRMLAKLGHKVMTLTRIAVGPITLKGLAPGEYRPLSRGEIDLLRRVAAGETVAPARFPERKARGAARPQGGRPAATEAPRGRRPASASAPSRARSAAPKPAGPRRAPSSSSSPPPAPEGRRRASSAGASARPSGGGRAARPVPEGRSSASAARPAKASPPRAEAPKRRIIGLAPGPVGDGAPSPRQRRTPPKRRFPRASLGPRRKPDDDGGE
jgi:23S rRNA pseudouridine2605 synthase